MKRTKYKTTRNMKAIMKTIGLAALGGAITLGVYKTFLDSPKEVVIHEMKSIPVAATANTATALPGSFNDAAEMSLNAVVHVKVASERRQQYVDPFEYFFGNGKPRTQSQIVWGTGSGVILSNDGYIVTNNHVIEGANKVLITLNDNREYEAEVIGADPTTDIALVKIEADDLSPIQVTNSDNVRIGDWVLAVGNPFNLTSTVTAGIVSAKGRSIGILDRQSAIESFIQTDAAVNPGNSGGALVNTSGQLVGINTAISTHTGSFEGYSFAVPSNIVKKVVEDIMEFGSVQRGFIGVNIVEVSQPLVDEMDLEVNSGVFIAELVEGGAAADAGLRKGDVITEVDGNEIARNAKLLEQIGKKRPGD
ncbi:MAG: trypsin-like peptidase domain-containing protein, partial [Schleiferiaceae bacterium]|nr:trypsin-like peptidase domain-containing protein [Schleiferiaceae bacterium]